MEDDARPCALSSCCASSRWAAPVRHRMVYATLGERMGGEIHALALKTLTPDEAANRNP